MEGIEQKIYYIVAFYADLKEYAKKWKEFSIS
jgi:hypothetical protein